MTREFGFAILFIGGALLGLTQLDLDPTKGPERSPVSFNAPVSYEASFSFKVDRYEIEGITRHVPGATRREFSHFDTATVVLDRWSERWTYVIFPAERKYGRRHVAMRERSMAILKYFLNRHGEKIRPTGTETFENESVTVYAIKDRGADFVLWVTKTGIIVRFEGETPILGKSRRVEYRLSNLNYSPQDAELFQVPKGFTQTR
jgi:uncharacterized protein YjiK